MGRLPFSFHPVFIFSLHKDALFHSLRTHCSNLPGPIVVDHGGYFGGATDMLMCGKSTTVRSTTRLLSTAKHFRPCNWFGFGHLPWIEYTMIKV